MLRQNQIPPEEQAEVFRRADELFRRETENEREVKAAADAAGELGVPQEYLDRAAAQVHAEKVEKIQAARKRRNGLLAVGAALALIGGITLFSTTRSTPRTIGPATVAATQPMTVDASTGDVSGDLQITDATPTGFTARVGPMRADNAGNYRANVSLAVPTSLSGYRQVVFTVDSKGVPNVRVDLESGAGVRFKGRNIPLSGNGSQQVVVPLADLARQEGSGFNWRNRSGPGPESARNLSFKFGQTVNGPQTSGDVTIRDIRFE